MVEKNFLENIMKQFKGNKNNKTLIILVIIGISLLIFSKIITSGQGEKELSSGTTKPGNVLEIFENEIQRELHTMLNKMKGVGKISVMVTLDSGPESIYREDITESTKETDEQDNQGGIRSTVEYNYSGQLVIVRKGGDEQPVVIKEIMPRVRGVLVVAEKGGNPKVRLEIQRAIQGVLDIPAYKISVVEGE